MTAWTVQPLVCWHEFQRHGILRADGRRVWAEFRPAYRWLMAQMAGRLTDYSGRFPIWLWCGKKPDLRASAHLPAGTAGVRIEAEISNDRVLLLDFQAWHCVLNNRYLALTWRQDREFDKRPEQCAVEQSWERVFDIEALRHSRFWGPSLDLQGVVEEVRIAEVTRVDQFTAR